MKHKHIYVQLDYDFHIVLRNLGYKKFNVVARHRRQVDGKKYFHAKKHTFLFPTFTFPVSGKNFYGFYASRP